jgi:hypothetical protein
VNPRAAFIRADRKRQLRRPATAKQRHRIAKLAAEVGMEIPHVYWRTDASTVIERLEQMVRQPTLGPM